MSVQRIVGLNVASQAFSSHPVYYLCTTTAELPSSGLKLGDTALAQDTNIQYRAASSTTWAQVGAVAGTFTKTAAFSDATAIVPATIPVWVAPFACTLTAIKGYRVGGTGATVQAYRNTTGTTLRSAALSLTSSSTWMDGGAVQNTAFASGDSLLMAVLTVAGSPTQISVQTNYTKP